MLGFLDLLEDLKREALLTAPWRLPETRHQELQQTAAGVHVGERQVDGVVAVRAQRVDKESHERGLPDARVTGDEPDTAGLLPFRPDFLSSSR